MNEWIGFIGAAALIVAGALMYAPTAPPEVAPEPEVVAVAPTPTPEIKPDGNAAPQGG